ncbi:HD domain-containing protein [Spirochaetota bacterium]
MKRDKAREYIELFIKTGGLKHLKRSGWVQRGIKDAEVVAAHIFRVCVISLFISKHDKKINIEKVLKMCILHDIPECVLGDITPYDGMTREEKEKREKTVLADLLKNINDKEYINLWDELSMNKSPEAILVNQTDKFEMALQAYEYKEKYKDKNLFEFIKYADKRITSPIVRDLFEVLKEKYDKSD